MFRAYGSVDPRNVIAITKAIAESRIFFHLQGIHSLQNSSDIIYGECLARMRGNYGEIYEAREFIPTLEIIGAISALDNYMIRLVLDTLEDHPHLVLACNISSDTILKEKYWRSICDQINARKYVADRLILEVITTKPHKFLAILFSNLEDVKKSGCRIAYGASWACYHDLIQYNSLQSDIIKIDPKFIWATRKHDKCFTALKRIVDYSISFAPVVVIEGVENKLDFLHAAKAGATHIQGYFLSKPISKQGGIDMCRYLDAETNNNASVF